MKILLALSDPALQQEVAALIGALPETEIHEASDAASALALAVTLSGFRFLVLSGADPADATSLKNALRPQHPALEIIRILADSRTRSSLFFAGEHILEPPLNPEKFAIALGLRASPSRPPLQAGTFLAAYEILAEAEPHARGRRFSASQAALNRPVTLTLLDPGLAADIHQREAFFQEARVRCRVHHPGILCIYEAGESEGWFFYAAERVETETLEDILQSGQKLPVHLLLQIALAVGAALEHLSANRLRNPPLEPSQVFLSREGAARLANEVEEYADDDSLLQNDFHRDVAVLGKTLLQLAPADLEGSLRALLMQTQADSKTRFPNWAFFLSSLLGWEAQGKKRGFPHGPRHGRRSRREKQAREKFLLRGSLAACALLILALLLWAQRHAASLSPSKAGLAPHRTAPGYARFAQTGWGLHLPAAFRRGTVHTASRTAANTPAPCSHGAVGKPASPGDRGRECDPGPAVFILCIGRPTPADILALAQLPDTADRCASLGRLPRIGFHNRFVPTS